MPEDQKVERRYSVASISIRRPYGKDGDYDASVNVVSMWGDEIKVKIPEERIEGMIDSVSDLIVDTLTQQLTNMRDDFTQHQEEKRAKLNPPSVEAEATTVEVPIEEVLSYGDDLPIEEPAPAPLQYEDRDAEDDEPL